MTQATSSLAIELRLLGPVDLWSPDGIAAGHVLSQPKRLALLAYLAAARPRGFHRRDILLALFWPELDQEHARAALRNTLHFLRLQLGDQVIVTRGDEVALSEPGLRCDVVEFDAAIGAGECERALAMYRGEFLSGLHVSDTPGFEPWLDAERGRLRSLASEAAWELAADQEHAGTGVASTYWMRVALDIDPDDEAGLRRLLRALEGVGDRLGAIREYERFARRLAVEYEVDPSPETRALVDAIRARASARPMPPSSTIDARRPSVVVLPFATLDPEAENDHFADGISEEIVIELSAVQGLRVITRASAARLMTTTKDLATIGRELDVQFAVEGSVRRDGDCLHVAARLVETATGAIVWAEKYVGTTAEVFDIQERVTQAVASRMTRDGTTLRHNARSRHQGNVHVYDCYYRALQELSRYSEEGLTRALEHVRNGVALAGENELLLATTAYVYVQFIELGLKPDRRYLDKAESYVVRAFRMNPESSLGHVVQGLINYKRGDLEGTVRSLKRALASDPNQRDALFWLSVVYLIAGREAAAGPLLVRLLEIDPLTPVNHCLPGYAQLIQGNLEGALPGYRRMHRMDAGNPVTRWFLALALGRCGRRAEALAFLRQIIRDSPGTTFARHALFLKHALERNRSAALAAVTPELLAEARWDQHASWWMGATYALVDEHDAALDWLSNASALGYINYPFLSRHDPFLESLRRDERFWQLMSSVKERWERFIP